MIRLDIEDPFKQQSEPPVDFETGEKLIRKSQAIQLDVEDPFAPREPKEEGLGVIKKRPPYPTALPVGEDLPIQQTEFALPKRGVAKDILGAGLGGLKDFSEIVYRTARALPIGGEEFLTSQIDKLEQAEEKYPIFRPSQESQEGFLRGAIYNTIRAFVPSTLAGVPGALLGRGRGSKALGFGLSGGTMFGLAEYDKFMEDAKKNAVAQGKDPEEEASRVQLYAIASGFTEGLGEAVADWLGAKFLGYTGGPRIANPVKTSIKTILKEPVKRMVLGIMKTAPIEAGTEFGQEAGETALRQAAGIETGISPLEAGKEAITPAVGMTILYALGIRGINAHQRKSTLNALRDPQATNRVDATRTITRGLLDEARIVEDVDPEAATQYRDMATQWDRMTRDAINKKEGIDIDQTITEAVEGYDLKETEKELPFEELTLKEKKQKAKQEKPKEALPVEELQIQEQAQEPQAQTAAGETPPPEGPVPELKIPAVQQEAPKKPRLTPTEGLPLDQLRYVNEIHELMDYVKQGEPGKKIGGEAGETISWGSSYPEFMSNKGWTKDEVVTTIEKALAGEKLGTRQHEIWNTVKNEARGMFKDRLGEQKRAKVQAIPTGDLEVGDKVKVNDEVLKVTEKTDEKIVIQDGQKYELDPYFDVIQGRKVEGKKEAVPVEQTGKTGQLEAEPIKKPGVAPEIVKPEEAPPLREETPQLRGLTLQDLMKSGRKEITEEELNQLPDVVNKLRTPESMRDYLETKGIIVSELPKEGTEIPKEGIREGREKPQIGKPRTLKIPEGWRSEVQGNWRRTPGWKSEVDWQHRRIVFETEEDARNIDISNHEVAHIRIEDKLGYIEKLSDSPILEEYAGIRKEDKDTHVNFVREHLAIDYGEYLTNPNAVDPALKDFFKRQFPESPVAKPELSPTAKDQYKLPGVKIGVEGKGKEEVAPTLEGTPLMEAAIREEREKVQPALPIEKPVSATVENVRKTLSERDEARLKDNTPKYESIVKAIEEGKGIEVRTQYKIIPLTKPEHIQILKNGEVQVKEGSKWVYLTQPQIDSLAWQSGLEQEEPKLEAEKKEEPRQVQASVKVSDWVQNKLTAGVAFTKAELIEKANEAFGGDRTEGVYSSKDAFDAMEMGVNKYLAGQTWDIKGEVKKFSPKVNEHNVLRMVDIIRDEVSEKIPSQQGLRTEEMDEFQQFSTPPDYALALNWVANINPNDSMLEPSAGIGGIATFSKIAGARTIVNELSPRRAALLKEMGFDKVYTENAEHIHNILPKDEKVTVVVMNPPFSATAGRIEGQRKTANSAQHIDQALQRLEPNGRLVALMGKGFNEEAANLKDWWKKILDKYSVRANILIEGKGYSKYGTSYDNRLIVIDKTGPTTGEILRASVSDIKDAIPLLKEIRDDRKEISLPEKVEPQPGGREVTEEGRGEARPELPAGLSTDVVGTKPGVESVRGEPGLRGPRGEAGVQPQPGGVAQLPGEELGGGERSGRGEHKVTEGRPDQGSVETPRTTKAQGERGPAVTPSVSIEAIEGEPTQKQELTDSLYETYTPERVKIEGAQKHPGKLVQSAAMATVKPPAPTYKPSLAKDIITSGKLSDAQLEVVVYAGQAHEQTLPNGTRRGFFIGDGTGVGKGREISGIIIDNMNLGRTKAIWISENQGLIKDALRDFEGAGGDPGLIFNLGKVPMGDQITARKGVMFATYGTIKSGSEIDGRDQVKQKAGKESNRLEQIMKWLGDDFDGVIVFDESHNMRNNVATEGKRGRKEPSLIGVVGKDFQKRLPNARFVYSSATGATEVDNLGYAERLGLWGEGTPFGNVLDFISEISSKGLAAMEVVARDLKAFGLYLSRNLSYDDVTYERMTHNLTEDQRNTYNAMADAWQTVLSNLDAALESTGMVRNGRAKGRALNAFWTANQRFFNQIITSLKCPTMIEDIKKQLTDNKSAVIQLVNTNEAIQNRKLASMQEDEDLEDLDLTPREQLMDYISNSFPVQQFEEYMDDEGKMRSRPVFDSNENPVLNSEAVQAKETLLDVMGSLKVPYGPLEYILNTFGTENVAEVTGRTKRVVQGVDKDGRQISIKEPWSKAKSMRDTDLFLAGKKRILVFSYAGSTGKSYHADLDPKIKNKQQRVHYLIQAGWRADKAIQGFGRTHRTNQASAPIYKLVASDIKGENRFISAIARRLDQLGALTKGQRQTGSQGMFKASDNLESDYARDAKYQFFVSLHLGQLEDQGLDFEGVTQAMALKGLRDETGNLNTNAIPSIERFLNRILSLRIDMQNKVFDAFMERIEQNIETAITDGTLDAGIENYKSDKLSIKNEQTVYTHPETKAETKYVTLEAGHKVQFLDFEKAKELRNFDGFYKNKVSGFVWAVQRWVNKTDARGRVLSQYMLRSPLIHNTHTVTENEFTVGEQDWYKWVKVDETEAGAWWESKLKSSPTHRIEKVNLITGTLLPIWDRLPTEFTRIYRMQTDDKKRLLGMVIREKDLSKTLQNLGVSTEAPKLSAKEAFDAVIDGQSTLELVNGWKIRRSTVQGEQRIELKGDNLYSFDHELKRYGVFTERINYETRHFIPTSESGVQTLERILKSKPISQVLSIESRGHLKASIPQEEAESRVITEEDLRVIQDRIADILPEGTKFSFVDEIWIDRNDPKFTESIKQWAKLNKLDGRIPGKVRFGGVTYVWDTTALGLLSSIEVATKGFKKGEIANAAYHEAWHTIRGMLLTEKEKAVLDERWDNKESEAEAFADWAIGKKRLQPLSVRRIFEKVKEFLRAFGNYLEGKGFKTTEDILSETALGKEAMDIFRRALSGEIQGQVKEMKGARKEAGVWSQKEIEGSVAEAQLKLVMPAGIKNDKSENPEVEKRMSEAYGLDNVPLIEKIKGEVFKTLHSFTRHFPELASKRFGKVIDILRRFEQVPEFAKKEAADKLKGIVKDLNKPQLNIFGRVLILNDLVKDYESGLYDHSKKLPFGYKGVEEVQRDLSKFEAIAKANKAISEALDKRKKVWSDLKKQLVDYEVLNEAALKDSRYFHHQVLQYMAIKAYHPEVQERKQYTGLSSQDVRLHRKGWQIAREGSALDFNTNYLESEFEVFSQAVAQIESIKTLDRVQEAEDISEKLKQQAKDDGKSASEWKSYLSEYKGYTVWQPKKGFNFYMANTITDKALEKMLGVDQYELYKETGKINIPGIGFAELDSISIRKALAVGKRRAEWAIPTELAKTLDNFRDFKDEGPIFRFAQATQSSWKQWVLLNPLRVIKYNLNNLSGDADIVLAYNYKILTKYSLGATKDLYAQLKGHPLSQNIHNELREAHRGGVVGSGITISEIPDISKTGVFKLLTGQKPGAVEKYWNTVKDYTNFRENVLRLAAYRFFKDELTKGHKLYGASKASEIDAITDANEKAAKLARELIGDYGNISQAGQWIRKNLIPFYCVPADAEILTRNGWKTVYDLDVNEKDQFEEEVLTYNVEGDLTEWQPLEDVSIFGTSGPHDLMTLSNSNGTKFRFTEEHRWPVIEQYGNKRKIVRSCDFKSHYKIPVVAPHRNEGTSILSTHDATLLGWIVTDGYFRKRDHSPNSFEAMIYQSPKKHADKIRAMFSDDISSESVHPDTGVICFRIKAASLGNIRIHFSSKDDLPSIVTRLDTPSLKAMFEAMMDAEGSCHKTSGDAFGQKDGGPVLDAFQIICYLLGKAFNIGHYKNGQHAGYIKKRDKISLHKWDLGKESYTGIVWCPKTKNSTWIMRQNGKVIITGNSWAEINAPRYVRLIQNLKHEGKRGQIVGFSAVKGAKLGVKMLLLYTLVNLWNHTFYPDEEEEMGRAGKKQLHLILGRRGDGTIRSLRFQGALSDALGWFGLEDFPEDFKEVMSGKVEWTKKLGEAVLAGPERLFHGSRPLEKAGVEALAGKSFYPDVTKPRPIRDKVEHILRAINLDLPYKYVAGKPTRSIDKELESLITYRTDPGETAYYNIMSMGRDYLDKQGYEVPSFHPTEKSNILYYYKQAQRIGDNKAAQKYMEKYIEAGGTKQDLMKSIKKSHPLSIIPMEHRRDFMDTLDGEDRKALERAVEWWEKVYGG